MDTSANSSGNNMTEPRADIVMGDDNEIPEEENDTGAVGCDEDEDENDDSQSYDESLFEELGLETLDEGFDWAPISRAGKLDKESIFTMFHLYGGISDEVKAIASMALFPVLQNIYLCPDFSNWFEQRCLVYGDQQRDRCYYLLVRMNQACSVLQEFVSPFRLGGKVLSGVEICIAIACHNNVKLKDMLTEMCDNFSISSTLVIPPRTLSEISLGPARRSDSCGVYGLEAPNGMIVIGSCNATTFRGRLNKPSYTDLKKYGGPMTKEDHRIGREDHILIDLGDYEEKSGDMKTLSLVMEAVLIALFGSSVQGHGLNSQMCDPRAFHRGHSFRYLIRLWKFYESMALDGEVFGARLSADQSNKLAVAYPRTTPDAVHMTFRNLSAAIDKEETPFFRPLPTTAFRGGCRPLMHDISYVASSKIPSARSLHIPTESLRQSGLDKFISSFNSQVVEQQLLDAKKRDLVSETDTNSKTTIARRLKREAEAART